MKIIWCITPEILSATDVFLNLDHFFPFYSPHSPIQKFWKFWKRSKFWKNEKNTWRYHQFTQVHHKWQSYDIWFLRYEVRQTEFSVILSIFCPFISLTTQKTKILQTWKNPQEISFCTNVPKIMIICYNVPEIWRATDVQ